MTGPGIARAVATSSAETLRKAIAGLAMQAREIVRLRAELADRDAQVKERDAMISTLQAMLFRGAP